MGQLGLEDNPRGAFVVHFSIAVVILITLAVVLRLAARYRSKAAFAVDDLWIVGSLLPFYGMIAASTTLTILGGMGRSITDLSPTQISTFLKITVCSLLTYSLTITSVKLSLLLLYRRIFDTPAFRRRSLVVGVACVVWWVVEVFTDIFQCHPFEAAFDPASLFTNRCINLQSYYFGITASNMGLDIIMLLLPLHMVWNLKLPIKQKVCLSGIFSMGFLACVAGAIRLKCISNMKEGDLSRSFIDEYLWSQIEPATAILCACLVTYRPLFTNISFSFPSKFSSLFSFKRGSSGASSDEEDDKYERRLQYQWSAAHGLRTSMTYQDMHAKVTKHGVHMVETEHGRLGSTTTCNAGSLDMSWPSKTIAKRQQDRWRPELPKKNLDESTFVVDFGALEEDRSKRSKGKDSNGGA